MKLIIAAPCLLALTAAQVGAQEVVGRPETSFSVAERISGGGWVRINSPNGFIKVTEGTGDQVEVQAEKDVRRGSLEDVGFVVRRSAGALTVCAVYDDDDECNEDGSYRQAKRSSGWWKEHQVMVNFTVRIPPGARILARTGNGDVSIIGGGAEVVAASGNGLVEVSGPSGEVEASSGNGRVTVNDANGPVEASSGNGDIRVTTLLGPVTATSGNGDIDVSMARLDGSPDMEFSTGNGRITVVVPEGFGAEFQSSTGNGQVTVDLPLQIRGKLNHARVRGTIGNGGGRLVLNSGNGDLVVKTGR